MRATVAAPRSALRGRPPTPGRREDILRAAEEAFARRDYHEVQMDDVARAAGVAKGTLYRYFRSKRDLHRAVVLDGVERLRREIEHAVGGPVPPARAIERVVRCTLGFVRDRRRIFALVPHDAPRPDEGVRRRARLVGVVQGVVERAIAAGQVRRVDARIATEILFGMMRAVAHYGPRDDHLEDRVAAVVGVFMGGAGTAAGKRARLERRAPELP
ncbi:MAG TPA: TetR/AcrR family transcriptional regulator [Candidatus Binatia bacterium]|nr:TetR/AcrR family transcriptional regulator [Candidatus Binatia bacterium]